VERPNGASNGGLRKGPGKGSDMGLCAALAGLNERLDACLCWDFVGTGSALPRLSPWCCFGNDMYYWC
jgi:hypothetical protein